MAERGDDVADASVTWPDSRVEVPFGTLTLTTRVDDQEPERRKIIFDPVPRVDAIDPSGDPLTEQRHGRCREPSGTGPARLAGLTSRAGSHTESNWIWSM
jgi:hypothetical protein